MSPRPRQDVFAWRFFAGYFLVLLSDGLSLTSVAGLLHGVAPGDALALFQETTSMHSMRERQEQYKVFLQFDADGSGAHNLAELTTYLVSVGRHAPDDAIRLMRKADTNRDWTIDFSEFQDCVLPPGTCSGNSTGRMAKVPAGPLDIMLSAANSGIRGLFNLTEGPSRTEIPSLLQDMDYSSREIATAGAGLAAIQNQDALRAMAATIPSMNDTYKKKQQLDMMVAQLRVLFSKKEAELDHMQQVVEATEANLRRDVFFTAEEKAPPWSEQLQIFQDKVPRLILAGKVLTEDFGKSIQKAILATVDSLKIVQQEAILDEMAPILAKTLKEAGELQNWFDTQASYAVGTSEQAEDIMQERFRLMSAAVKSILQPVAVFCKDLFKVYNTLSLHFQGNAEVEGHTGHDEVPFSKITESVTVIAWKFEHFAKTYTSAISELLQTLEGNSAKASKDAMGPKQQPNRTLQKQVG